MSSKGWEMLRKAFEEQTKKYVEISCSHRHPNFFCLVHGCHCEGDEVHDFPECPGAGSRSPPGVGQKKMTETTR